MSASLTLIAVVIPTLAALALTILYLAWRTRTYTWHQR